MRERERACDGRTGLDLVEDEEDLVLVAELAQALHEGLWRHDVAALAGDRLHCTEGNRSERVLWETQQKRERKKANTRKELFRQTRAVSQRGERTDDCGNLVRGGLLPDEQVELLQRVAAAVLAGRALALVCARR